MTFQNESAADEEAMLADAPEGDGKPRRPRRTREQIEQEKIEKAQARIEAIKKEQATRRIKKAIGHLSEAFRSIGENDAPRELVDSLVDLTLLFESLVEECASNMNNVARGDL